MESEYIYAYCSRLAIFSMPTFLMYHGSLGEVDKFTCGPARAAVLSRKVTDVMRGYCLLEEHRDKQVQQPGYQKKQNQQQQQAAQA